MAQGPLQRAVILPRVWKNLVVAFINAVNGKLISRTRRVGVGAISSCPHCYKAMYKHTV